MCRANFSGIEPLFGKLHFGYRSWLTRLSPIVADGDTDPWVPLQSILQARLRAESRIEQRRGSTAASYQYLCRTWALHLGGFLDHPTGTTLGLFVVWLLLFKLPSPITERVAMRTHACNMTRLKKQHGNMRRAVIRHTQLTEKGRMGGQPLTTCG